MRGRALLTPARDLAAGPTEAYWRTAAVNAYYALLLECRDTLAQWGIAFQRQQSVHASVRLKLLYAADTDLKKIGRTLETLGQLRNLASYHLIPLKQFASGAAAQQAIQDADDALTILDAIEADPARRAAAIAALPP